LHLGAQTLAGLLRQVGPADTKTVKLRCFFSMQILKPRDVRNSYSVTIASRLRSSAARMWEHASTFAGVNCELWPLAHRTFPPALG